MWTDPAALAFTNGAKVGATVLNREVRDNLRFLHDPPSAIATHDSNQTISRDQTLSSFYVLDFSRTIKDNASIHGATETGAWPATAGMRAELAGVWLQQANVPFGTSYIQEREIHGVKFANGLASYDGSPRTSHPRTNVQGDKRPETLPWARMIALSANQIVGVAARSIPEDSEVVSLIGVRQPLHGMHWMGGTT